MTQNLIQPVDILFICTSEVFELIDKKSQRDISRFPLDIDFEVQSEAAISEMALSNIFMGDLRSHDKSKGLLNLFRRRFESRRLYFSS